MTDNEIIKALECCIKSSHLGDCFWNDCPFISEKGCKVGKETLYPYALDLINRQKAEIERLTTLANLGQMRANDYRAMRDKAKNARAEAIKEFAERVSAMITEVYNKHIFGYYDLSDEEKDAVINFSDDVSSGVDNLAKEMTEGTNGES